ncbi:MAG: hypothetical protein ACK41C_03840 [Phenylobacterium sp.]|uniref:hypothetical protein n=1 Tax=Phenylobacterium sp. TaxID=1871053 RepID=UPI003918C141
MRLLPVIACALALAAAPALAQKTPPSAQAGLRGPVQATPAPEAEAAPAELAPPRAPAPAAAPADPARCRMTCASAYYFCIAQEASDDCPGSWGQCRAACGTSRAGR